MKKILGRATLVTFLMMALLSASYHWEVKIDKRRYFQDEAFLVTFLCHFEGRSPDMYIEFKPKVKDFIFEKYDFDNQVIDGRRETSYRYFVKAKSPGTKRFFVEALMRQTTDESIKETVLGRDNAQELVFTDTKIVTKPLMLEILPIPSSSQLVGSFKIETSFSKERLKAYEPLQLKIKISGQGDFTGLTPFDFSSIDAKLFAHKPEKHYKMTDRGYEGYVVWRYAMTSAQSFTLPAQEINYFDAQEGLPKKLSFGSKEISVEPLGSSDKLIDAFDYPPKATSFDWASLGEKSLYFFLGMLSLYLLQSIFSFRRKIKRGKRKFENINELLSFLIESEKYAELLTEIEDDMRSKRLKSLASYLGRLERRDRKF